MGWTLDHKRVEMEIYMMFHNVGISGVETDKAIGSLTEKCYEELSKNEHLENNSFSYAIKQFCLEALRNEYVRNL